MALRLRAQFRCSRGQLASSASRGASAGPPPSRRRSPSALPTASRSPAASTTAYSGFRTSPYCSPFGRPHTRHTPDRLKNPPSVRQNDSAAPDRDCCFETPAPPQGLRSSAPRGFGRTSTGMPATTMPTARSRFDNARSALHSGSGPDIQWYSSSLAYS